MKFVFHCIAHVPRAIDGPHRIVRLLAVCTREAPFYMIMEFMARGDLKASIACLRTLSFLSCYPPGSRELIERRS
jgi:hypothetical protein